VWLHSRRGERYQFPGSPDWYMEGKQVLISQDCGVIQVGGGLGRFPVQPSTQNRIKPGCFIQLSHKSLERLRWHKLSGQSAPLLLLMLRG